MIKSPDITIIGGGVIGLLTARELFNAGATVTVIEKKHLGQESSWAGGGILMPLYPWRQADAITRLTIQSLSLYPTLASQLLADTRKDPEWTQCGILITKNPDYADAINWCKTNNVPFEVAESHFFDALNTIPDHPLWLPSIAQARNPRLVKSLIQDLVNKGITLIEQCELIDVMLDKNQITHIKTSTGLLPVQHLIISAGAWTGSLFKRLFPELAHAPHVAPVKGQMLLFDAQPDMLPSMVLDGDLYLIPRRDGKILAGSTVEYDGFNKSTSLMAKERLTDFALTLLPALKKTPLIHHWAGLRPGTQEGVPYIDLHPEIANLSINAGHFRNGLIMGPASAQLMVDLILKRTTAVSPEPYQLSSHEKRAALAAQ
jgi:glycine oxidase